MLPHNAVETSPSSHTLKQFSLLPAKNAPRRLSAARDQFIGSCGWMSYVQLLLSRQWVNNFNRTWIWPQACCDWLHPASFDLMERLPEKKTENVFQAIKSYGMGLNWRMVRIENLWLCFHSTLFILPRSAFWGFASLPALILVWSLVIGMSKMCKPYEYLIKT